MKRFTAKLNANYFENITERDNFLENTYYQNYP